MFPYHIDKSRTAGSHFLLALGICLTPLFCLALRSQVSAKSYFHKLCESQLFHCLSPACHCDIRSKLSFCRRSKHRIDMLSGLDRIDNVHDPCLRADRAERTAVDTFSAADTFLFIDHRDAVLVVRNRVHRAAELTRSLKMCDGIVRTGLCTFSAFFTF